MWLRRVGATQALEVVRGGNSPMKIISNAALPNEYVSPARDQIWVNPGFHEQLVLFELCQYAPSRSEGIYTKWRAQLDRRLPAADR
jgi:dual specificity phosphatase 12